LDRKRFNLETSMPTFVLVHGAWNAPGGPRSGQAEGIDDYHELQTGHDAMVTAPTQVAELPRRIARTTGGESAEHA
jgi:hypothetical protein